MSGGKIQVCGSRMLEEISETYESSSRKTVGRVEQIWARGEVVGATLEPRQTGKIDN